MINEEIIAYIKARQEQNTDRNDIVNELKSAGWDEEEIVSAFQSIEVPSPISVSEAPPAPGADTSINKNVSTEGIAAFDDLGGLISGAFSAYFKRFGTYFGILIMPTLIMCGVFLGFAGVGMAAGSFVDPGFIFIILVLVVLLVAVIFLQILGQVALLVSVHHKTGISESYKRALPIMFSYVWVSFLVGIVVAGGMFLLIVPGIMFAVWFGLATFVLVVDGDKGVNALAKSREYVRGHGWQLFGYLLLFALIVFGIFVVVMIPLGILSVFLTITLDLGWVSDILQQLVSSALKPLGFVFGYSVFMSLRATKNTSGGVVMKEKANRNTIWLVVLGVLGMCVIGVGILASIVLASLNSARGKGYDANIKANLSGMQSQAELYYDDGGYSIDSRGYEGYCEDSQAQDFLMAVESSGGDVTCNDSKQAWAASAQLASDRSKYSCVDHMGASVEINRSLMQDEFVCPDVDIMLR
ncbi:MAG: hypothetical protein KAS07_03900 [Candidatus Pacebacteria bacterium]|nr:hypothetical protein [Candidatus Paceibacterota bacterium]